MRSASCSKPGWGVLAGVPALFALAFAWPSLGWVSRARLCAFRSFAGFDCPGCGLIRSFTALVHGRVREAIDFHPMGPVIALWLVYLFARSLAERAGGRTLPPLTGQSSRDILLWAFVAGMMLQWVVKLAV